MEEDKNQETKKWYQKTWVVAAGLVVTHVVAATVGYVIGANSGGDMDDSSTPDTNSDQV
jgi:hypothetical protein